MDERKTIPPEPRSPDEAAEAPPAAGVFGDRHATPRPAEERSGQEESPPLVFEERGHASDSSGLAVDDPARAQKRREQYRNGATEVSELD